MLSTADVEKLAHMARLEFHPDELEKFKTQLSGILEYVKQLGEVDTDGVEPTSQVTGLENVTRSDEAKDWVPRDELLSTSELPKKDGMIEVPSVFE